MGKYVSITTPVTTVNGMGHREESNEQDLETLAKLKTVLLQKENG